MTSLPPSPKPSWSSCSNLSSRAGERFSRTGVTFLNWSSTTRSRWRAGAGLEGVPVLTSPTCPACSSWAIGSAPRACWPMPPWQARDRPQHWRRATRPKASPYLSDCLLTPTGQGIVATMATAELYQLNRDYLWGLCYRMTGNASDAEDIVQETFVRVLERPPARLNDPLRPWLVQVAVNLSRDYLRRRRRSYTGTWLPSPVPAGSDES